MPVLASTDKVTPRSVIVRNRPVLEEKFTTGSYPITRRASRPRPPLADDELVSEWKRGDVEEEDEEMLPAPRHKSAPAVRAIPGTSQKRASMAAQNATSQRPLHRRAHPLLYLGLGMLAMLALWTLLSAGLNWWTDAMNYLHYGYPRTFQTDAVVGHADSTSNPSHFLAINLHGRIEIIEFPGGDSSHARIYLGPQLFGTNADKAPVTLQFADINGDRKPDMLVFFQSSWIVFINNQHTFSAPTQQEQQDAARYLSAHGQ